MRDKLYDQIYRIRIGYVWKRMNYTVGHFNFWLFNSRTGYVICKFPFSCSRITFAANLSNWSSVMISFNFNGFGCSLVNDEIFKILIYFKYHIVSHLYFRWKNWLNVRYSLIGQYFSCFLNPLLGIFPKMKILLAVFESICLKYIWFLMWHLRSKLTCWKKYDKIVLQKL